MTQVQKYKQKFFDSSIADILRAIQGQSLLGAFILTVSSIAALSEVYQDGNYMEAEQPKRTLLDTVVKFLPRLLRDFLVYWGKERQSLSNFYRSWVKTWFRKAGVAKPHEGYLYAVRCALVHTYGHSEELERQRTGGYSLRHNEPQLHWQKRVSPTKPGFKPGYIINLDTLVAQYIVSASLFFDEIDKLKGQEARTSLKRLEALLDIYDPDDSGNMENRISPPKTYSQMHPALANCDSGSLNIEQIRVAICALYSSL